MPSASSHAATAALSFHHPVVTAAGCSPTGLPQVFTPIAAAEVLRGLGLADMTECALRTRAYRQQVPFHLNGRRIVFTLADLREIAEGQPRRPRPQPMPALPSVLPRPVPRRRPVRHAGQPSTRAWRARTPGPRRSDPCDRTQP